MKIVTVPHPTLRKVAQPVEVVDARLIKFIKNLEKTLRAARNPGGVGLAANQVDKLHAVFTLQFEGDADQPALHQTLINPLIQDHSEKLILGLTPTDRAVFEEGCLSMPGLWGAVPRWSEIKLRYQLLEQGQLVMKTAVFTNFIARVIQHEIDHLQGILFTDHALQHNLPVYLKTKKGLLEVDKSNLESF